MTCPVCLSLAVIRYRNEWRVRWKCETCHFGWQEDMDRIIRPACDAVRAQYAVLAVLRLKAKDADYAVGNCDKMRRAERAARLVAEAENVRLRAHYDKCPLANDSLNASDLYEQDEAAEAAKGSGNG